LPHTLKVSLIVDSIFERIDCTNTFPLAAQNRVPSMGTTGSDIGSNANEGGTTDKLTNGPTFTNALSTATNPPTNPSSVSSNYTTVATAAAAAASAVTNAVSTFTTSVGGTLPPSNDLNKQRSNSKSNIMHSSESIIEVVDDTGTAAKKGREGNSNIEKYRAMVESQRPLGFTHALELECFRIQLGLDERTRDNVSQHYDTHATL
jgi:hypothetical protein